MAGRYLPGAGGYQAWKISSPPGRRHQALIILSPPREHHPTRIILTRQSTAKLLECGSQWKSVVYKNRGVWQVAILEALLGGGGGGGGGAWLFLLWGATKLLGVQIRFEGFFGGLFFVNLSKLICTLNIICSIIYPFIYYIFYYLTYYLFYYLY